MRPILTSFILLGSLVSTRIQAEDTYHIQKDVPNSTQLTNASNIALFFYDGRENPEPLLIRTLLPGEWQLKKQAGKSILFTSSVAISSVQDRGQLWVELEVDGQLIGKRESLSAGSTGITFAAGNPLDMSGNPINGVADPTLDQDAATKAYVDDKLATLPNGDITGVTVALGSGLTGGGSSGNVALGTDNSVLQTRVTGTCTPGSSIRVIDSTGAVTCETDSNTNTNAATLCPNGTFLNGDGKCKIGFLDQDGIDANTTYTASTGLNLSGSTFSIDSSVVARKDTAAGNQAFDLSTLYLDYNTHRVGIGDSSPSEKLDVNGTVAAADFSYRNVKTFYKYIGPEDIAFPSDRTSDGTRYYVSSGIHWFQKPSYIHPRDFSPIWGYANIDLPQGANITRLTCYFYDSDPDIGIGELSARLQSRALSSTAYATLAEITTSNTGVDSTNILQNHDSTVLGDGDPVDNSSYAYSLFVDFYLVDETGSAVISRWVRFYGCRLSYQMTGVAP